MEGRKQAKRTCSPSEPTEEFGPEAPKAYVRDTIAHRGLMPTAPRGSEMQSPLAPQGYVLTFPAPKMCRFVFVYR